MNTRQEIILDLIVKEYTNSALPVSSLTLVEKYNFNLSPASVRLEMLRLENDGYLRQLHTSSGRIPTNKGLRYFVDVLMKEKTLNFKEQKLLRVEVLKLKKKDNKSFVKITAKVLSLVSGSFATSCIINSEDFYKAGIYNLLSQPEFIKEPNNICEIASIVDNFEENVKKLSEEIEDYKNTEIYIGNENPVIDNNECGMIASRYKLKNGEDGLFVIVGTKRMRYSYNVSLVNYMKELLSDLS